MLHAVLVHGQTGGDDIGTGNSAVHDLLGVTDGGTDDLGLAVEAVVLVDLDDVLDVLLAILAVGFLPADEGGDEQGAVLGGQDGHGGGEDQGHVGADAQRGQPLDGFDPYSNSKSVETLRRRTGVKSDLPTICSYPNRN